MNKLVPRQVYCDACLQSIVFSRYVCVTCIDEDFSNQLDLCTDNPHCTSTILFAARDFVHSSSHTLLRTDRHILSSEVFTLFTQSNQRSERIKKMFRSREEERKISDRGKSRPNTQSAIENIKLDIKSPTPTLKCSRCDNILTLPCWACAICSTWFLLSL